METTHITDKVQIIAEPTPNPQSYKFVVNRQIVDSPLAFTNSTEAEHSPLASKLFGFPWMQGVFIGQDFVTISKQDWVDWDVLAEPLRDLLEEHFNLGLPVLGSERPVVDEETHNESDDPTVRQIVNIIDHEIRPAVQMDGGDIVFKDYKDHIVYLKMKGSCAGCPSSTYTLKMGIETRLKEAVPEIIEVVSV